MEKPYSTLKYGQRRTDHVKVKVSTSFPEWPLERQTPNRSRQWGNRQFYINEPIDACDYWVVYDGLRNEERARCPRENTIFITGEPPAVKKYNQKFLNQFAMIITCQREIAHPNVIYSQQALQWMVGGRYQKETHSWAAEFTKDYDELTSIKDYKKDKLISIILSKKSMTEGHRKRLEFVYKLKDHFGDQLDVFGVGLNEIEDKWDGIASYKYHLAIENSAVPDYWTEKLADAFLAGAYPFYYGCPNIFDYFPGGSLTLIDIDDLDRSISIIENDIKNNQYENSIDKISEAKNLVLDRYNLFPMLGTYCSKSATSKRAMISLKPEQAFLPKPTILSRISRKTRNVLSRLYARSPGRHN